MSTDNIEQINYKGQSLVIKTLLDNANIHYIVQLSNKHLELTVDENGEWKDVHGKEPLIAIEIGKAIEEHFE